MNIKRIHCKKHHAGDWVTRSKYGICCILCAAKASEWWDIEGALAIYIPLSSEPPAGAYEVGVVPARAKQRYFWQMDIVAENGEGTHTYAIFPKLGDELRRFYPTCYMGIEII